MKIYLDTNNGEPINAAKDHTFLFDDGTIAQTVPHMIRDKEAETILLGKTIKIHSIDLEAGSIVFELDD